jgi:hypothetical protein
MHRSDLPRSARHPLRAAVMAVALTALPPAAPACAYDGLPGDENWATHPASLAVVFAIHDALGKGKLAPLDEAPPALAWLRVNAMVQDLHRRLARPGHAAPPAVALLLVEARLWNRFQPGAGVDTRLRLEAHASGPRDGDVVLVTGEPVLKALLEGRLDWQRAIDGRLVVIAGESHLSERLARILGDVSP